MKDAIEKLFKLPYGLIVSLRVFAPFLIWKNVFWTLGIILFLDLVDGLFFKWTMNWPWDKSLSVDHPAANKYKQIDKLLDFYWYIFILAYIYMRAGTGNLFLVFFALWLFRLAGMVVFYTTKNKKTFMFFPNLFEMLFIVYVFTLVYPCWEFLFTGNYVYFTILLLLLIKLVQEYLCYTPKLLSWLLFFRKR